MKNKKENDTKGRRKRSKKMLSYNSFIDVKVEEKIILEI